MSRTYYIACKECKECLWVGQKSGYSPLRIYAAQNNIDALAKFLDDHMLHELFFADTCLDDFYDYKEIEA